MPETEFNTDFVESLINMIIVDQFKFVPFDDAWNAFSKYTFNFKDYLKPDIVKDLLKFN